MILSKVNHAINSLIHASSEASHKVFRATFTALLMLSALQGSLQASSLFITLSGSPGGAEQIDTRSNQISGPIFSGYTLTDLVASHDGRYLYATVGDASLLIYDTVLQTTVNLDHTTLSLTATAMLNALLLSPDGTTLYAADEATGYLIAIDISTWQVTYNLDLKYESTLLSVINLQAISPDGSLIYFTANNGDYVIYSHDTATSNATTAVFDFFDGPFGFTVPSVVKLIPDGSAAYVLCNNSNGGNDFFYVTDLATTSTLHAQIYFPTLYSFLGTLTDFILSPDGSQAYLVGTGGYFAEVLGGSTGTFSPPTTITANGSLVSATLSKIVCSSNGNYFYALDNVANLVHVLDPTSNSDIAQLSIDAGGTQLVVARATPRVVFTLSDDQSDSIPIIINLLPNVAPQTVTNFLALAAGNYYDGSQCLYKGRNRIEIPHAIDQSIRDGSRSYFSAWKVGFAHENLSRTPPLYSVVMVRYADNLSGSGFFITTTTNELSASHTVFGIVTDPQSQTFLSKLRTGSKTGVTIASTRVQL